MSRTKQQRKAKGGRRHSAAFCRAYVDLGQQCTVARTPCQLRSQTDPSGPRKLETGHYLTPTFSLLLQSTTRGIAHNAAFLPLVHGRTITEEYTINGRTFYLESQLANGTCSLLVVAPFQPAGRVRSATSGRRKCTEGERASGEAMPGTTMVPNTRDARASRSRISSPQVNNRSPNGAAAEQQSSKGQATGLDNQKAFMARWLEPPVTVKPSYQDAGLVRHGVVEGMAPLGTLPKVGIFKKTAAPSTPGDAPAQKTPPPTRIVLKQRAKPTTAPKSAPAPVTPAAQTEDDTEEVDTEEDSDTSEEEGGLIAPPPLPTSRRRSLRGRADYDGDWAPAASKAVSVGTKSVNTRRSSSRAGAGRASHISLTSPSVQHTQTSASSVSRVMESIKDVADKVVEAAVDEAIRHYRYPTAWALRMLYDENSDDGEFLSMVQEVFTQTADAETVEQFARLLSAKKRDGKKGDKGFRYFIPPATSNSLTPHKPKKAPYGDLVRLEVPQVAVDRRQTSSERGHEQEEGAELGQQAAASEQPQGEPAQEQASPKAKRKRLPEEPQSRLEETPSKKRRKSSSKASELATPAAATTATPKATASAGKKKNAGTPATASGKAKLTESPSMRRKTRAASVASSSSTLSSARSLTPPDGIMDSDQEVDVPDVPPSRTSPSSPAAETVNSANAPKPAQPIARPKRNNAPKKKRNVSPTTPAPSSPAIIPTTATNHNTAATTNTTTRSQQQSAAAAAAASSMPALVEPPVFPNLLPPKKSAYKAAGAQLDKGIPVFASRVGRLDDNDEKILLRQKAKNVTNRLDLSESFERGGTSRLATKPAAAGGAAGVGGEATGHSKLRSARASVFADATNGSLSATSRNTRSSRKRSHDEVDDEVSPTTAHFPPGAVDVASSATDSRAATPILRPAKKAKTGARVKQS